MADAPAAIRLIAGLGNPGERYEGTRHNVGESWVRMLAQRCGGTFAPARSAHGAQAKVAVAGQDIRLFLPDAYVNESGRPVAAACRYYRIAPEQLLLAHDDLDLPCGAVRLKFAGGSGGHKGVRDVCACVGDKFWRMKFGIGHPERDSQVVSHVLHAPTDPERRCLEDAMERACRTLDDLARGEFQRPMKQLHTRPEAPT